VARFDIKLSLLATRVHIELSHLVAKGHNDLSCLVAMDVIFYEGSGNGHLCKVVIWHPMIVLNWFGQWLIWFSHFKIRKAAYRPLRGRLPLPFQMSNYGKILKFFSPFPLGNLHDFIFC